MKFENLTDDKQQQWYMLLDEQAHLNERVRHLKSKIADWVRETDCLEPPAFTPRSIQRALSEDVQPMFDNFDSDLWRW